jgi:predicted O-methyltransferase YrrM
MAKKPSFLSAFDLRGLWRSQPATSSPSRSRSFRQHGSGRFWWHTLRNTDYVPPVYARLSDQEWALMAEWFSVTQANNTIGEINVPAMDFIQGLIMGNGIQRIVQLGHYCGYSALLIGFMLRAMRATPGLISFDISQEFTSFSEQWVARAGLTEYVKLVVADSASEKAYATAKLFLNGDPELILVDSSHQYTHTLAELDLWAAQMKVHSIMLLHDTSQFASNYDSTGAGGVSRAIQEWLPAHPEFGYINLNRHVQLGANANNIVYKDGCGLGILQRQQ